MADTGADTPSPAANRNGRPLVEPAAVAILGVAALAVAALLLLMPAGGALAVMLAVVVAFVVIHVGCLTVGCGTGGRRGGSGGARG